ncbi:MAG: biotin--[acetyl-CoA-carboxylase] ligase [candidate division WOR-3 bacterium]|nr:MAG: biotin--[acetyl-CoA-carboxylase] ligase [candidate division WOR-3 bacterium]
MIIGNKLYYFDTISSTNDYAKTLLYEAPEGTVVLADEQTDARGRHGTSWYSPPGGLWMSVLLQPEKTTLLSIAAGVAVCSSLHTFGITPGLKWPNDIIMNRKKIGGILTEIVDNNVIVGIGVNLNIRSFPQDLRDIASSVFLQTKKHLDKKMVFDLVCREFDEYYGMLKQNQDRDILSKWRDYTVLLGQQVTIQAGDATVAGKVLDIGLNGALIVMRSDGQIEHVSTGVCHLH